MFKAIKGVTPRPTIFLRVDGQEIQAQQGDTIAMALLSCGVGSFRTTPVSDAPRAPLCMMGVCFDCLVNVDGRNNVQACMAEARAGMNVTLPHGANYAGGAV